MNESIKDAVKYISQRLKSGQQEDILSLVEEASRKYDLNALQSEFLLSKYLQNEETDQVE